jgi:hypothetical protein
MQGADIVAGEMTNQCRRKLCLRFVLSMTVVSLVLTSPAVAFKGYIPGPNFASPGAEAGQVQGPEGVASNITSSDIYIADTGNVRVDQFDSGGQFIRAWGWGVADGQEELEICTISCEQGIAGSGAGQFSKPAYVAVDNSAEVSDTAKGDVYAADSTNNTVQRFSESGAVEAEFKGRCETAGEVQPCAGSTLTPFEELYGVAVDTGGNLWVYDAGGHLDEFDSAGHYLKTIVVERPPQPGGLALDSHGTIYVSGGGEIFALRLSSETGEELPTLPETISLGVSAIAVAPETDNIIVDDENRFDLYGPFGEERKKEGQGEPFQIFTSEGLTDSHGLTVGNKETAYVTLRTAGRVQTFDYVPLPPKVEEEAVARLSPTEATISAHVNPLGEAATYHLDYGITPSYGASTPEQGIGAPAEAVPVQATLTGLQPNTTYHFRVVAKTAAGITAGEDQSFTTAAGMPESTTALPDGRVYELVSDPTLPGPGEVYVPFASLTPPPVELVPALQPFRASVSGDAVAYVGDPGISGGTGQTGFGLGNEFISRRNAQAGHWESSDITPQITEAGQSAERPVFESFSEDLSNAFFGTGTTPDFSKSANPEGPGEGCGGLFMLTNTGYHALFGEKVGVGPTACGFPVTAGSPYEPQNLLFAGGNRGTSTVLANSQLLMQTPAPLTPGDHPAAEGEEGNNLYVSVDGHAHPVGVLPNGEHDADAALGSTSGQPLEPQADHMIPGNFSNIISADGSRIFWTALEPAEEGGNPVSERLKALYVREDATSTLARTIQLDASEAPAGSGVKEATERSDRSGGGRFWTATPDGAKVFFTDCSRLTEDSSAESSEGCEHRIGNENVFTGNDLYKYDFSKPFGARLTDLSVDPNESDGLGSDVQGVIGASEDGEYVYFAANGVLSGANVNGATPTSGRPNLYLRHGGTTTFIGQTGEGGVELLGGAQTGSWRPNLGYRAAAVSPEGGHLVFQSTQKLTSFNNNGTREVYLYTADGGAGQLICASCASGGTTAGLQGSYLYASTNPTFTPRWMNSEGSRVFFNSDEPLVPQDNNGVQDVYEWERAGHGSCTSQPGCIYLLSGATNHTRSYLIDSDASGDNVFFTHRGTLGDIGISSKRNLVLDARVGGGFPPQSPPECTNCQATVPPPTFSHSPAETFSGPGNLTPAPPPAPTKTPAQVRAERLTKALKACRAKHNHAKRLACERQARRRFGPPHKAKTHKQKKKTGKAKKSASRGGGRR